ncbi:hypothetical protein AB0L44_18420 [Nonomuraea wenchangensis]|uniref:hypothetical protein n=1 Tax=Nonomuraea wenchangensis TaxID=568860 RepID=UPI00343A92F4
MNGRHDTGPRHPAAAVGTPTVAVYWCVNLVTYGPLSRTTCRGCATCRWTTYWSRPGICSRKHA